MVHGTGSSDNPSPPENPATPASSEPKLPQNARKFFSQYQNAAASPPEHDHGSTSRVTQSRRLPVPIRQSQRQQQPQQYSHSSPRFYASIQSHSAQAKSANGGGLYERRDSNSFARATEILSLRDNIRPHSLSSSPAAPSRLQQLGHINLAESLGNDSDSTTSSLHRKQFLQQTTAEQAEIARRLKKHLVTRPVSNSSGSSANGSPRLHSSSSQQPPPKTALRHVSAASFSAESVPAAQPPDILPADDGGYTGDINDDDDDDDDTSVLHTMPLEHSSTKDNAEEETIDPFLLPSGDMTHQIYRWHGKNEAAAATAMSLSGRDVPFSYDSTARAAHGAISPYTGDRRNSGAVNMPRRRSFSGWDSDSDWDIPYRPGQLNVPGGFRRQFVRERAERQGRNPPGIIAESFIDFIALYGHFAGGNYLSEEDEEYFDYIYSYSRLDLLANDADTAVEAAAAAHIDDVPDERTPLQRRSMNNLHATASNKKAFFLVIKAFVGTGVLVLPRAFYNGGLLTSCVMMVGVAWYAWHCILLLAEVYLRIGGGSYSDIGLRLYGRWMQYAVTSSIVLAQIGGCCAYTIFVAQNWRNVFDTLSSCRVRLSTEFWVLIQIAVFVPLALIRQIRYFAPVALVANVLIIVSLGYLLGFDLWSIAANGPAPIVNYNPARFPLLVGTAVYSFEGVTLVIPILDSLKEKHSFGRILTLAITFCLGLFLCVGSLSYLTFGESVEAVVLLNLPNQSSWTIVVQVLYSVAILFSMPLQLFPAVKIMEAMMFTRSGREHKSVKWQKNIFRIAMVVLIALIAIFGADQLDNVVALVGSFCLVPLSFIYPSSMHLKAVACSRWTRTKDIVLIVVGVIAMVYVTYISIDTWGSSSPPIDACSSFP
ncbi:hypothetical protein IW140_000247 [Coemansia sp. RSA 1813]|nr:hypothetical protein EV178_000450 [Coemansia sp. RSA 1646]KAJ1773779.1 hypothetical protein LPJ74_000323 [Coemansia sp. RSA 1843]KAJ2093742.1 hypothetical protein IW138_000138 [Coemansia sp. RSA 986]KAJ2217953.1 hypothetical protein EV179_000098 [Coemansia sp. RSA 487]KAJ2573204.1 hypothetical protein IW140_000247 [Coemansia sp. RSA 1813]